MENSDKKSEAKKIFWMAIPLSWAFSPKIVYLTSLDDGFFKAYFIMLAMAARTNATLTMDEKNPYTERTIAPVIGFGDDWRRARRLLSALDELKLRDVDEAGGWYLPESRKFTQSKSDSALRMARMREREKSDANQEESPQNTAKSERNGSVTRPSQSDTAPSHCDAHVLPALVSPPLHPAVSFNPVCEQSQQHPLPSMPTPSNSSVTSGGDEDDEDDLPQANYQQLTAQQRKAAKAIKRLPYPKPIAFGMLDSVYGWVAKNNPTDEDVASMQSFLETCLRSPDWQKRLADSPDGRYLPSIVNFLRGWSSHASIQDILAFKTPEDKERQEKVDSAVDEFQKAKDLDDSELLAMEAAGQLTDGDVYYLELAKRRSVGLIPPRGEKPAEKKEPAASFKMPDVKKF